MKQTRQLVCAIKQSIYLDVYAFSITTLDIYAECHSKANVRE